MYKEVTYCFSPPLFPKIQGGQGSACGTNARLNSVTPRTASPAVLVSHVAAVWDLYRFGEAKDTAKGIVCGRRSVF